MPFEPLEGNFFFEATGIEPEDLEPARRSGRGRKSAAITLSISQEDKTLVKTFAVQRRTTVSELFHQWIQEHYPKGIGLWACGCWPCGRWKNAWRRGVPSASVDTAETFSVRFPLYLFMEDSPLG